MIRTGDRGPKTTLLVASPALLTQWAAEIDLHIDLGLKVMKYGAGNRLDSTHIIPLMNTHDIILTSYTEIMKSYPKNDPPIECQTAEQKIAWWKETYKNYRGVLHQMHFKRIVLDEAQAIKNHKSRTSVACRALIAHHKWALSGTPILNGLDELYPYFKFLNVPHTGSFKIFKNNYCGNGDGENAERLLVRLSQFMIRRTHADRMFNAPILKLPQANQSTYWCDFNSVERCIYIIVHQRFAARINMWSKKGSLERAYSNVLVMLLRLRQLTGHILMLQFVMRDLLEREDIERIKDVVKEQAASSNIKQGRTIISIRKQLEAYELREKRKAAIKAAKRAAAEEAAKKGGEYVEPESDEDEDDAPVEVPRDGEAEAEEVIVHRGAERNKSGRAFGKSYDFKPYVNSLTVGESWEKKKEKAKCGECGKRPYKPWKTACGHLICSEPCYEIVMNTAAEEGKINGTCKACGETFFACTLCEEEDDDDMPTGRGTRARAAAREKKKRERLDREDIADDWLSLGGDEVLPSAKTMAVKAQVLNWLKENPNVKVIIYTQFLAMLVPQLERAIFSLLTASRIRILAKICQQEGWRAEQVYFTPSSSGVACLLTRVPVSWQTQPARARQSHQGVRHQPSVKDSPRVSTLRRPWSEPDDGFEGHHHRSVVEPGVGATSFLSRLPHWPTGRDFHDADVRQGDG
jgi:SNF2 family DNA or RNA helicase